MPAFEDDSEIEKKDRPKYNFEEFVYKYRIPITLSLLGLILVGFGMLLFKSSVFDNKAEIEVLESTSEGLSDDQEIVIEVSGAVEKPGVYRLTNGDRIDDALTIAGGVSADADRKWMEKFVNRAAKLIDGQKIYIPTVDEVANSQQSDVLSANVFAGDQSVSTGQGSGFENRVNVNTASQSQLESLWGIGPVTAQNIIEQRPYSNVEELLSKKILKSNVYERNKDLLTVY